jgi:solute carrier family 45 protein 1/2/4
VLDNQGIHNVFIVMPQLIISGLSSIIFAIFEPGKSVLHGTHPSHVIPPINGTSVSSTGDSSQNLTSLWRQADDVVVAKEGVNKVAFIILIVYSQL